MIKTKNVKKFYDGSLVTDGALFYFDDVDGRSEPSLTVNEASDAYYLKQASDYLGNSIRDNSLNERIEIGKQIDQGSW